MNRISFAILIILFLGINIIQAQPRIKFEKTEHDFGDVVDGTLPTYSFKFKNTGNKDLMLKKVQSSCGCTSPSWPRQAVAPGDSSEIKVVFNTRGYKNKDFVKSVMITSNAVVRGQQRTDALLIRGHVVPKNAIPQYPLRTSTLYHDFGFVKQGKKTKYKITFYNEGDSVITFNKTELMKGYDIDISFKPQQINPKDSAVMIIVFNTKLLEPGKYDDRIKVLTNINEKSTRKLSKKGILIKTEVVTKEKAKKLKKDLKKKKS